MTWSWNSNSGNFEYIDDLVFEEREGLSNICKKKTLVCKNYVYQNNESQKISLEMYND